MHKLRFQRYQSLRISYAKSFKMLQATSTHWSYLNLPVSDASLFLLAINPECLVAKAWTSVIPASSMFQIAPLISLDAKWGTWWVNHNRVHPRFIHQWWCFFSHCCTVRFCSTPRQLLKLPLCLPGSWHLPSFSVLNWKVKTQGLYCLYSSTNVAP